MSTDEQKADVVERICHKEQLGIWANELASALALSDFLKEDWTFDDSVDLDREIAFQLRDIMQSAFTHPEFNVTATITALRGALSAALATIEDYLAYEHDGDPWAEDSRAMGEMDINAYATDGRLEAARSTLKDSGNGSEVAR